MMTAAETEAFKEAVPLAGSVLNEHSTEEELANALAQQLPPLKCVGTEWYFYVDGAWRQRPQDGVRPEAMAVQHPRTRKARTAAALLDHLEIEAQCDAEAF